MENNKIKQIKEIEGVFITDTASVMGDITIGKDSSIWYGAVLRGDEKIRIGKATNIQDNSVLHADVGTVLNIGNYVTVGHGCILHGCDIGDNTLVGMGSIVLNGARNGKNCLIGAGSLVTGKMVIPDNCMAYGRPARVIKQLSDEEIKYNTNVALKHIELVEMHKK